MIDLERSLEELAERLEVQGGEWLVNDVLRRVGDPAPRRVRRPAPRLAGAIAVVIVVVLVVLPGPRRAVGRWLGFDSVRIEPTATVPTTRPPEESTAASTTTTSTTTTSTTVPLDLGESVSLQTAMSVTGLPDPTPTLLGDAQSVHVVQPPASGQIVLVYAPSSQLPQSGVTGTGAIVSVMPAHINEGFFGKTLGPNSTLRSVAVDGASGYWIEGSPHELMFEFGNEVLPDTLRLASNTLLWQVDDRVYRLEADVDLATALQIAESVQSGN